MQTLCIPETSPVVRFERTPDAVIAHVDRVCIRAFDCTTLAGELSAVLDEHPGPRRLIVDFSGVEEIAAACLMSLLDLTRRAEQRGCTLVIASLPQAARKVLKKTGHHRSLVLTRDVHEVPASAAQGWMLRFGRRAA